MKEPGTTSSPTENEPAAPTPATEDDPYADLESVFDEPIVIEDADLQAFEAPADEAPAESVPETEENPAPAPGISGSGLLARLEALEGEVRAGSDRTLEALRRLGERVGTELAMLDKRAINLELTIARLRSVLEGSGASARRLPETPAEAETETLDGG
jgi:hypothetical protein